MRTSTNTLENAQAERNLYYYGARYLDPTNAMWLSVDPLWEKYVGMSPYQYCAGNPITYIDPNGENLYGVNSEGYIALIEENEDEKDIIYAGAHIKNGEVVRDKEGKVKGLEYDKDNKIDKTKNESIEVKKGILKDRSIKEHKFYSGTKGNRYYFDIEKDASDFFEFMAQNTNVEWGFYDKGLEGGSISFFVTTSHEYDREIISSSDVSHYVEDGVSIITFHKHSHPLDYSVKPEENAAPSDFDTSFAYNVQDVYTKKRDKSLKFSIYSRKKYHDYTPN